MIDHLFPMGEANASVIDCSASKVETSMSAMIISQRRVTNDNDDTSPEVQ